MEFVQFYLIDVFSTTAFRGNPLAIVMAPDGGLSDTQMKLIARQFNLSETTFVLPPSKPSADYRLRSFLPVGKEVFGAGHNILGTWWFLAQSHKLDLSVKNASPYSDGVTEYTFYQELGHDVMPVRILQGGPSEQRTYSVALRQVTPKAHNYHPDPRSLAKSIGVSADNVGFKSKEGTLLKPRVMSTSTTRHLLVPLSSHEALDSAVLEKEKVLQELAAVDESAYGIFLFTPSASPPDGPPTYKGRFFSPGMSGEDPATGSAAGPLSVYLYDHRSLDLCDGKAKINVLQGDSVGRDCLIEVQIDAIRNDIVQSVEVDLIGGGALVGHGEMSIPHSGVGF
ncbi:3-beta-hydroxysteroid-Delta(8),Delta(7)-isomerase [Paramyrothecium foliicola]|nr:3-beta-hydroxysteroid-Delta(8),Delta(7)-isomerase [Paramyrothecium foliicola]